MAREAVASTSETEAVPQLKLTTNPTEEEICLNII